MRKILFSDLDGTVIDGEQLISKKDLEMLHKMRQAEHLLVFCTSRNKLEADTVMKQHELPYDYLILNNGTQIVSNHGEELFSMPFSYNLGMQILEYCQYLRDYYVYFYDSKRHLSCGILNGITLAYDGTEYFPMNSNLIAEAGKSEAFDMIGIKFRTSKPEFSKMFRIAHDIKCVFENRVEVSLNTPSLSITPNGQSKGSGLQKLVRLLPKDFETYSIGDSINDISMFEAANHSFTFFRCSNLLKTNADQCVNYVYEVIEKILL